MTIDDLRSARLEDFASTDIRGAMARAGSVVLGPILRSL